MPPFSSWGKSHGAFNDSARINGRRYFKHTLFGSHVHRPAEDSEPRAREQCYARPLIE